MAVGRGALIGAPEGGGRGHSVVVTRAGAAAKEGGVEEERVEFAEAARGGTGVPQEVGVWAEALVRGGGVGQLDARQSPREALRDLEIVSVPLGFLLLSFISWLWEELLSDVSTCSSKRC